MWRFINRFYHLSIQQALYPLLLSSFLACLLFAVRYYFTGSRGYSFLVWNLFLAWLPYLASFLASYLCQPPRRWWPLLILGPLWLAFLPNAPYILTDLIHLRHRPPVPIWYDTLLIASFAWTGLFLAVFSLRAMQLQVKALAGRLAGWLFVLSVVGLTGLGVYLGRFMRWNSWDLLFNPQAVLADIVTWLANPLSHLHTFGVISLFACFLLICYLTIVARPSLEQS
jgi:uncharacterized membrane protein